VNLILAYWLTLLFSLSSPALEDNAEIWHPTLAAEDATMFSSQFNINGYPETYDYVPSGGFAGMFGMHGHNLNFGENRDYDPDLGRWTSRDPVGETGGQNLYEYAANDPIGNADPSGLCPQLGGIFGGGQYRDVNGDIRDQDGNVVTDRLNPLNPINFEGGNSPVNFTPGDAAAQAADTGTQMEFQFAKELSNPGVTYLYQKVGAQGEHLKFGITVDPATRYTAAELNGGRLRIIAQGENEEMLRLERQLHETLPIGPEEGQIFYIQKQVQKGLRPPPY
jgi:RHS repeat-associated protein